MEVTTEVDFKGPMFDGRAERAYNQYLDEAEENIAREGKEIVHARLRAVLRNPTGYYESRVAISREADHRMIHDSKVIYGRWLEGVNEYNFPTTRFRGYKTFELAALHLRLRAKGVAERTLPPYLRRMNGRS